MANTFLIPVYYIQVLKEQNYKALQQEKEQQRKEKAIKKQAKSQTAAAQQMKNQAATNQNVALDNQKEAEVKKHVEITKNQHQRRCDWTEVNTNGLDKTNLTIQQQLAKDFGLSSDKSDGEEDDTSSVSHSKRGLSPPVDPSPTKLFKQSGSPVQSVKQSQPVSEREIQIQFLPDEQCRNTSLR